MLISDKFTRGWVAGACGGLLGGILGFQPYYIGISSMRITDWSSILVLGRKPPFSLTDQLYGLFVLAWSTGCVGIIFAFLLPLLTEKNIYFKGWIIFLIPWWLIYLLTALAKIEGTLNLSVMTALTNGISTSIMGLTAVYCYRLFGPK
ncbi:hypothetical protein ACE38V_13955 [Cytobacillus sp. Hz8]|uniref:hypothetical protein n=1 Tax=Cytobacillus sp. Hz8 TaxID=3347168 RepID=UPI0035E24A6A